MLLLATQTNSRYATQIPRNPPIMKNTTDEIENCPAPQMLGMKLPISPPTNPPVYVGPLRTNPVFGQLKAQPDELEPTWTDGQPPWRPLRLPAHRWERLRDGR